AHRRFGEGLLAHLGGGFTVVVLDTGRRAGFAAIDRVGIGRLCYAAPRPGTIVFGTSADAVARHPAVQATLSDQGIFDFLSFFAVPCPTTIYLEQRKLRPAQVIRFGEADPAPRFYWQMPYDETRAEPADAIAAELKVVLRGAVGRACRGTDPSRLGAFLSGGLDSSTVAGLLAGATHGRARTFTVAFAERDYDESGYARVAARHFATDHHEHVLTPADAVTLLPRLAEAYDEPFANTSAIPAFYCAKLAKESGVDVMLAGDGGDELFAGNSRYLDMVRMQRYHDLPAWLRRGVIEPVVFGLPLGDRLGIVGKVRRRVRRRAMPMPERMHFAVLDREARLDRILAPGFLAAVDARQPIAIMREVYERTRGTDMVQRMMHHDLQLTLADNDLRKVGRMCELAGVRVRYPMLDDDVLDFSVRVTPRLLMADGRLRGFYKDAMRGFLPEEILAKRKHGFGMPFGLWIRTDPAYRAFCLDGFNDFARRGILAPRFVEAVMASARGNADRHRVLGVAIDVALLESWLRHRTL
ncbi:MAG: asparagine synthase C-terminal domain-containing protein, partial [Gammaproteobacteria bacterium]